MLVGFLGAPCSGKTTTAARLFAELKDLGIPAEFITEYARTYIANRRYGMASSHSLVLQNEDQMSIAEGQFRAESVMKEVCPDQVIITDSSVLNSLLYMTPEFTTLPDVFELVTYAINQYDLLFLCGVVPRPAVIDGNRLHSEEESFTLQGQLEVILNGLVGSEKLIRLEGQSTSRLHTALGAVLDSFVTA